MRKSAGSESPHLVDKPARWSAKCHGAKRSDVTTIKARAIEVKKSFFRLLNPRESAKDRNF